MRRTFFKLAILLISPPILASSSYYCPNSGEYIYPGYTESAVISACGQPANKQSLDAPATQTVSVSQWVYNTQNTNGLRTTSMQVAAFVANIANDKVLSLLVNGQSVSSSNFCNINQTISVGDNSMTVLKYCGTPSQIQKTTQQINTNSSDKESVLTYQFGDLPTVVLNFSNGVLTSISP